VTVARRGDKGFDGVMARAFAFFFLAAALPACQDPTQIKLELSTDVLCTDLVETKLWVRDLAVDEFDLERAVVDHRGPEPYCSNDGRIGSIVAVPRDDDDAAIGLEVITRVGNLECARPPFYGPGCIIARRGVRFLPQTSLELPIRLTLDCLGVVCEATETCQAGQCVDAQVTNCSAEGCDLDTPAFVDPETLGLAWARVLTAERFHRLAAIGGRVIAAGEESATGGGALVAAFVDGGLEAWRTSFGHDTFVAPLRIGVVGGRARVLGQFSGSFALGGTTLAAPDGGVFSAFFGLDGQPVGAESFTLSFSSGNLPASGNLASVAFSGDSMAVSGACMGEVEVGGKQVSSVVDVPAGFLGLVGAHHEVHLLPDTASIDDIVFDPAGDLYVAGRAPSGDAAGGLAGEGDIFVARLDPRGQEVRWARSFRTGVGALTQSPILPGKLVLGPKGLAYLGSHVDDVETSAGVVQGPVESGVPQIFVLALSSAGEITRAHGLVSDAGSCQGRDIAWTPGGGIAIVAETPALKPVSLDGAPLETSSTGLLVVRLDEDGEHLVISVGEAADGSLAVGGLNALAAASNGDLYVSGSAGGTFSVGGQLVHQGQGFLIRFAP
jgi:hypothetical protein